MKRVPVDAVYAMDAALQKHAIYLGRVTIAELLATVAPIIAAAEREAAIAAAAKALDAYGKWDGEVTPERLMKPISAAIRALGDKA